MITCDLPVYDINEFHSDFGYNINKIVKSNIKKLASYCLELIIGIVQRLDKNNIPREITSTIFRLCGIDVNLSTNRKFTLNGRELLMIG
jgi:hypothetical protein